MGKQMLQALMNPIRIRFLSAMVEGPVSARSLARQFDLPLRAASFHMRVLDMTACVDPTPNQPDGIDEDDRLYESARLEMPAEIKSIPRILGWGPLHPAPAVARCVTEKLTPELHLHPPGGDSRAVTEGESRPAGPRTRRSRL